MAKHILTSLLLTLMIVGCAAPEEPAALKSSKGTSTGASAKRTKEASFAVSYGGAAIGDDDLKAEVKKCVDQGKFFDRTAGSRGTCTTVRLAEVSCTDSTISSIMDERDKSDYASFKKGDLAGYMLDQCLDCSSPVGNSYCEGTKAAKVKDPGVRLYHVKVNGSVIDIKTIYVYK